MLAGLLSMLTLCTFPGLFTHSVLNDQFFLLLPNSTLSLVCLKLTSPAGRTQSPKVYSSGQLLNSSLNTLSLEWFVWEKKKNAWWIRMRANSATCWNYTRRKGGEIVSINTKSCPWFCPIRYIVTQMQSWSRGSQRQFLPYMLASNAHLPPYAFLFQHLSFLPVAFQYI